MNIEIPNKKLLENRIKLTHKVKHDYRYPVISSRALAL